MSDDDTRYDGTLVDGPDGEPVDDYDDPVPFDYQPEDPGRRHGWRGRAADAPASPELWKAVAFALLAAVAFLGLLYTYNDANTERGRSKKAEERAAAAESRVEALDRQLTCRTRIGVDLEIAQADYSAASGVELAEIGNAIRDLTIPGNREAFTASAVRIAEAAAVLADRSVALEAAKEARANAISTCDVETGGTSETAPPAASASTSPPAPPPDPARTELPSPPASGP